MTKNRKREREKERERRKLSYLDNKYVRVFYSSFFPKIAYELLIIPSTPFDPIIRKVPSRAKTDAVISIHEAFQHYYI